MSEVRILGAISNTRSAEVRFLTGPAYNGGSQPVGFVASPKAISMPKHRQRLDKAIFLREANSGVFQDNPSKRDLWVPTHRLRPAHDEVCHCRLEELDRLTKRPPEGGR